MSRGDGKKRNRRCGGDVDERNQSGGRGGDGDVSVGWKQEARGGLQIKTERRVDFE